MSKYGGDEIDEIIRNLLKGRVSETCTLNKTVKLNIYRIHVLLTNLEFFVYAMIDHYLKNKVTKLIYRSWPKNF